ncbi:MAG: hypothetical protein JHC33_02620 [Ignisphaera sp.]|nr:hypothetical protein [Ignisphaera sp.]
MESQTQILKGIADRICRELGTLCFSDLSDEELEKMLMYVFTWVETFYYIDPVECAKDEDCASKALEIHGAVVPLALRNQYTIYINEELIRKTVEGLQKIEEATPR